MREINLTRKQPLSLGNDCLVFKVGEEEDICVSCNLPAKKCNGDCKRYKEEMEKLKRNGYSQSSTKPIKRKTQKQEQI